MDPAGKQDGRPESAGISAHPDGRNIAFISLGSLLRAEVFLDVYIADANTGERKARLTKSTLNPEYEELRYGGDGTYLAAQSQPATTVTVTK